MQLIKILAVVTVGLIAAGTGPAQEEHGVTPQDLARGETIFFNNCATCHGPNGDGIAGINFSAGKFRKAVTDQDLINIIRTGIPGTEMPPGNYTEAQAATIAAYLRSMSAAGASRSSGLQGDAARGKMMAEGRGKCLDCHQINNRGGFLGPDLSGIGAVRRSADLERSLREPTAEIRVDNHTVRAVGKDGSVVRGRLLNEDTYSVQIIQADGKLRSLQRKDWRAIEIEKESPMPDSKGFSDQDVADIVAYLGSLTRKS